MFKLVGVLFFLIIFFIPALHAAMGTADPLYLGVGARPLGMGKAFSAVANDGSTAFTNPAGLGFVQSPKLMSMTTKILMEVDYQALGIALPLGGFGTLGLGYVGRNIGDIALGSAAALAGGNINTALLQYGSISDQVVIVSWGLPLGAKKDWSVGSSLRQFTKSSAGALLNGYAATGFDADLGLMWQTNRNLRLSAVFQNFLPNNRNTWGGVQYSNGTVDSIDVIMKLGLAYQMGGRRWLLAADLEKNLDQSTLPYLLHMGVEWHPADELFFRAGLDQTPLLVANSTQGQISTQTDPTMGLGFNWGGIRFDYAFHPFGAVENLTSHFFSISLVGAEPVDDEPANNARGVTLSAQSTINANLVVLEPVDKSIVRDKQVVVLGTAVPELPLRMDGSLLASDSNGKFQKNRILNVGRNDIVVSAGKDQVRIRVLRLAQFRDVEGGSYREPIEYLTTLGTLQEDGDGQFNGKRPVTRAELADILVRIKNYQLPASVAAVWENFDTVVNAGLIQGYPNGKYKTVSNLTNAQLAVLLARLEFGTEFKNDVKCQHWADNAIDQLVESGTYQHDDFMPYNEVVSKEKLALFLYKTKVVRTRVDHMINFEDDFATTPVTIRNTRQTKDMEDFQSLSEGH